MLSEPQAAELFRRCQRHLGKKVAQVKGNLSRSKTRAAQVWELLLLHELAMVGEKVLYEPKSGGSPDFLLTIDGAEAVWIEAAYLYPRHESEIRRAESVLSWIWEESKRRSIDPTKLVPRIYGEDKHVAGPKPILPLSHEPKEFLSSPELVNFFNAIENSPLEMREIEMHEFTVQVKYDPSRNGPNLSSGGIINEMPQTLSEHAVFRKLKEKAEQHSPVGPYVVWIGSQDSPALDDYGRVTVAMAVEHAHSKFHNISATIVTRVVDTMSASQFMLAEFVRVAETKIYENRRSRFALSEQFRAALDAVNLNRWKFGYALSRTEPHRREHLKMLGPAALRSYKDGSFGLVLSEYALSRIIAGTSDLTECFGDDDGLQIIDKLKNGYLITGCEAIDGNVLRNEPKRILLRLTPPKDDVFWPQKTDRPENF